MDIGLDEDEECIEFESPKKSRKNDLPDLDEKKTPDGPSANESYYLNELGERDSAVALLSEIFPESSASELLELHMSRCRIASPPRLTRRHVELPEDFLRLPSDVAVRRQGRDGGNRYEIVHEMEQRVIVQHAERGHQSKVNGAYFTKVLPRDASGGLGMTVADDCGFVRVLWLDGLSEDGSTTKKKGPALLQGVQCGDILVGIDGIAFLVSNPPGERLVKHVVDRLRSAPDPVVLHLQRPRRPVDTPVYTTQSLLDTSYDVASEASLFQELSIDSELSTIYSGTHAVKRQHQHSDKVHSFTGLLRDKGIIHSVDEMVVESRMMSSFHDTVVNPGTTQPQAFSTRIVNRFKDNEQQAYTLWVFDVGTGKEWYAPTRYWHDFRDLQSAVTRLNASIAKIPFPKERRTLFRSPGKEKPSDEEAKCKQLEAYVRSLCHLSLDTNLPNAPALSMYIQSFLGCAETNANLAIQSLPRTIEVRHENEEEDLLRHQSELRIKMRRAIQRYTYRVLMLNSVRRTVETFVQSIKSSAPTNEDFEELEAKGAAFLKKKAMVDMKLIQSFLDNMQDLLIEGCSEIFTEISQSPLFAAIQDGFRLCKPGRDDSLDGLIRDAVREQVEIDVYVPLRSVVSRWLVQGWRHDDMEIHFKVQELQKKSADFFRIPHGKDFDWEFAIKTLAEGVGHSTLPRVKLKAIVASAREIFRVFETRSPSKSLGADDFLPIFIFCVVHAKLERPCALLVLLRTLCDEMSKIGEVGYYLLTFEAAITHCHEVDLTEDREHMTSFLSVPLDEPS